MKKTMMKLKDWFKGILNKLTPTFVRYALNKIKEDRLQQLEDIGDVAYFEKQFGVKYGDIIGMMEHHTPYHQTDEYQTQMKLDLEKSAIGNGFPWAGNILYNPDMVQIHNEGLEYSGNKLTLKELIDKEGQRDFHKMNSPSMFQMISRMNSRMKYNRIERFDEGISLNTLRNKSDEKYDKGLTKLKDILTKSKEIIDNEPMERPTTENEMRVQKAQDKLKNILRGNKKK